VGGGAATVGAEVCDVGLMVRRVEILAIPAAIWWCKRKMWRSKDGDSRREIDLRTDSTRALLGGKSIWVNTTHGATRRSGIGPGSSGVAAVGESFELGGAEGSTEGGVSSEHAEALAHGGDVCTVLVSENGSLDIVDGHATSGLAKTLALNLRNLGEDMRRRG
jgi:hypothetical protein